MARRRIVEVPTSRLALWSRRFAVFALAVSMIAVIILRVGIIESLPGLATFGGALVIALVAILLAFGAFVVIWREGFGGLGAAVTGLGIAIALLVYPAYLAARAYGLPALNDITTDTGDPPRFERIAVLRPREANPIAYPGAKAAELQRATYPDIEPIDLTMAPQIVYEAARSVIVKRKWLIIIERAPQAGRREGHIEAIARTPVMGFRDDVVVRIRPDRAGTRLDIRSASRYGTHDLGTNARRVRALAEDIEETAGAQPAVRR